MTFDQWFEEFEKDRLITLTVRSWLKMAWEARDDENSIVDVQNSIAIVAAIAPRTIKVHLSEDVMTYSDEAKMDLTAALLKGAMEAQAAMGLNLDDDPMSADSLLPFENPVN